MLGWLADRISTGVAVYRLGREAEPGYYPLLRPAQAAIKIVLAAAIILLLAMHIATAAVPDARWLVLAARQDQGEAIHLARAYARSVDGVRVVRSKNGWFAVIVGPVGVRTVAEARAGLADRLYLPDDTYLARLEGWFSDLIFEAPLSPIKAISEYHGAAAAIARFQSLTVVLSALSRPDGSRIPTAEIRADGMATFRTVLADVSMEGAVYTKARIIQLDPSTTLPQVVLTTYTGGAHCCTITKIASPANGSWSVFDGRGLDGEGYEFEDVDGDGFVELINVDNSFLYTFESYAGSFAPPQVSRFRGRSLTDVTLTPSIRPYLRSELAWMEGTARKTNSLWSNNGYLAGWVATKAQLGEVDEAWQRMVVSYDRNPMFGPEECTVSLPIEKCPADRRRQVPFPNALRAHLIAHGYLAAVPVSTPPVLSTPPTARFPIVRYGNTSAIEIINPIEVGDAAQFERTLSSGITTVILNSPGGLVEEGLAIARQVHTRKLGTHVVRECASMCFAIFAAGRLRSFESGAEIGVHSASTRVQGGTPIETERSFVATMAVIRTVQSFGSVPENILGKMVANARDQIAVLTAGDLLAMGAVIDPPGRSPAITNGIFQEAQDDKEQWTNVYSKTYAGGLAPEYCQKSLPYFLACLAGARDYAIAVNVPQVAERAKQLIAANTPIRLSTPLSPPAQPQTVERPMVASPSWNNIQSFDDLYVLGKDLVNTHPSWSILMGALIITVLSGLSSRKGHFDRRS
jgi:Clp protease